MRLWVAIATLLGFGACATSHFVRPLGKGNGVVNASLGGPLVQLGGADFPTPIVDIGGGYGVRDDTDIFLRANLTAAAFGDLHLEPGVAYHPLIRDGGPVPTVTIAGSLHFLTDFRSVLALPQLSAAVAWSLGRRHHLVYGGADLAVSFEGRGWVPIVGPYVGGELRVSRRIGLMLEAKYLAPNYNTGILAPTWIAPSGHGYVSILLGVNVHG